MDDGPSDENGGKKSGVSVPVCRQPPAPATWQATGVARMVLASHEHPAIPPPPTTTGPRPAAAFRMAGN